MSILERLFGNPQEGETRELPAPAPITGYLEQSASHEYFDGATWQPAVVERLGAEQARYVVPALRTWPDEGGE